jgi:hypothetical protein
MIFRTVLDRYQFPAGKIFAPRNSPRVDVFDHGGSIKISKEQNMRTQNMRTVAVFAVLATTVAGGGASAQSNGATNGPRAGSQNQMSQMNQSGQSVRQTLQKHLQDAGFSDIQMIPTSFMVRARDSQGRSVSLIVTPDSVLAVTEITDDQTNAQSPGATTGSASGNGADQQGR